MSYDGTPTPGSYQGPDSQVASPQQIYFMQAIAKALMGNQPQFMQSWTQPLGQMANTAVAMQMLNRARQSSQANAAAFPRLPLGPSSAPLPQQPQPPGAPSALSGINPFMGLDGLFGSG